MPLNDSVLIVPTNAIRKIEESANILNALIQQERYEDAAKELEKLDACIRKLTFENLQNCNQKQKKYLHELANWLVDCEGDMQRKSQQLVDAVAPFSKKLPAKFGKHYQDK